MPFGRTYEEFETGAVYLRYRVAEDLEGEN